MCKMRGGERVPYNSLFLKVCSVVWETGRCD